jgi:hypothetical protein
MINMQSGAKQVVRFASSPVTLGEPTPTKTYFSYVLCHALPFFNANRDTWTEATMANSFSSVIDHPHNIEHVQDKICGHIYDAVFVESTEDTPACIVAASVLYNHVYPDITEDLADEDNPWAVSMECMFGNIAIWYDGELYTDASEPIVDDLLDNLHGTYEGKPVVRVCGGEDGEVIFSGAALTECPADEGAVIQDVATASQVKSLTQHLNDMDMPVGQSGPEPIILPGSQKFNSTDQLEEVVAHLEEGVDEVVVDRGSQKRRVVCRLECNSEEEGQAQMDPVEMFDIEDPSKTPEEEQLRPTLCMVGKSDCMNFDPTEPKDGCANAIATDDGSCANYNPGFPLLFGSIEDAAEGQHIREVYPLFTRAFFDYDVVVYVDGDAEDEAEFVAVIYHWKTIEVYARETFTSLSSLKEWLEEALDELATEIDEEIDEMYKDESELIAAVSKLDMHVVAECIGLCEDEFNEFIDENSELTDAAITYKLIKAQDATGEGENDEKDEGTSLLVRGMQLLEEGVRRIGIPYSSESREEIDAQEDNTIVEDTSEGGESNMPEELEEQVAELREELAETEATAAQQQEEISELSGRVEELTTANDELQTEVEELTEANEALEAEKGEVEQEFADFKAEVEQREHERVVAERKEARWAELREAGLYANADEDVQERVQSRIAEMEDDEFEDYLTELKAAMPASDSDDAEEDEGEEASAEEEAEEEEEVAQEDAEAQEAEQAEDFEPSRAADHDTADVAGTDPLGNQRTGMGMNVEQRSADDLHSQFERLHGARAAK